MIANPPALSSALRGSVSLSLRRQAETIKQSWSQGASPDTLEVLRQRPELAADPIVCLDLAYEEYRIRREAGEVVDVEAFCSRFPLCRSSLKRLIGADLYFSDILIEDLPIVSVWPAPGEKLGDFTLVRELGRGTFAHVYLATEASAGDRPVVLKVSPKESKEGWTLGRLTHPSIVPILSAHAQLDGMTVICMPFQGTVTLENVLDSLYSVASNGAVPARASAILDVLERARRPDDPELELPPPPAWLRQGSYVEAVLHLGEQLAEALDFLHRHQVCHRDLKPSNVLLRPDGQALLLDFNLSADARLVTPHLGGTVPYMAPEQIEAVLDPKGDHPLDERADLFSFAVILYELLTGQYPFGPIPAGLPAQEVGPLVLQRQREGCLPLATLCPQLPRALARLLERCLAFDRRRRPASAAVVLAELRRHFQRRQKQRRRSWLAAGFLALVSTALLGVSLAPRASEPPVARVEPAPAALFQAGLDAYQAGHYEEADSLFRQVPASHPLYADALFHAGRSRVGLNDLRVARSDFQQVLKLDRARYLPGVIGMGGSLGTDGGLLMASTLLERERMCGPTLAYLAYCCSSLREHQAAEHRACEALACGFGTAAVHANRGYSLLQRHQREEAQRSLDEALQLDPDLPAAHLSCVYKAVSRRISDPSARLPEDSFKHLEKALKGKNQHAQLYLYAARLYALAAKDDPAQETAHKGQAITYLQEALRRGVQPDPLIEGTFADLVTHPRWADLQNTPRGTITEVWPCPFLTEPWPRQAE